MTTDQARHLINTDPDFISSKRFNYSLSELIARYPDGAPDRVIAAALLLEESDVENIYQQIVLKLRKAMGVKL